MRKDKTHSVNSPPKVAFVAMTYQDRDVTIQINRGDVLSRVSNLAFRHFGIVYGLDKNNVLWILENNKDGVNFVTLHDFLAGYGNFRKETKITIKNDWNILFKRAVERSHLPYHVRENNCQHFSNYVTTGVACSDQVELTEGFLEILARTFQLITVRSMPEAERMGQLEDMNNSLEKIGLNKHKHISGLKI